MFSALCLLLFSAVAINATANVGLKRMDVVPGESSIFTEDNTVSSVLTTTPTTATNDQAKIRIDGNDVLASRTTTRSLPVSTNHVAELDLSTSFQNKTFLPLVVDDQDVPISCLNCSTSGILHVSGTDLSFGTKFTDSNNLIDFDGGLFNAQLPNGLEGRIELALTAPSTLSHTFNILTVPMVGFAVPGLADAGVWLNISIQLSIELLQPASVSFGFEFGVPQYASILIDVGDRHNSTVKGLDDNKQLMFTVLPVHVSEPGLDVRITASLVLDIAIGAKMLENDLVANVGAAVQIPKFSATERQLDNVDSQCDPFKNGTTTHSRAHPDPETTAVSELDALDPVGHLIGNYTNIIPAVGMDVSVYVETGLAEAFGGHDFSLRNDANIFHTMLRQSTICINNSKSTQKSSASSTSTATATTSSHSDPGVMAGPTQTRGTTAATPIKSSAALRHNLDGDLGNSPFLAGGRAALLALAVAIACLVMGF